MLVCESVWFQVGCGLGRLLLTRLSRLFAPPGLPMYMKSLRWALAVMAVFLAMSAVAIVALASRTGVVPPPGPSPPLSTPGASPPYGSFVRIRK